VRRHVNILSQDNGFEPAVAVENCLDLVVVRSIQTRTKERGKINHGKTVGTDSTLSFTRNINIFRQIEVEK
jgi:hypothetical protein